MIISYGYDVECFPNMFSIIFVDMIDYLQKFADCVDDKGKPIPMAEKISVAEIKARLDSVKNYKFYISDTNDSQLLELVAFINNMQPRYEERTDENGNLYITLPTKNIVITQSSLQSTYGVSSEGYQGIVSGIEQELVYPFTSNYAHMIEAKADSKAGSYLNETNEVGGEVLTSSNGSLTSDDTLMNLVTESMYKEAVSQGYNVSYAITNGGRDNLPSGSVTYSNLFKSLPFLNCPIIPWEWYHFPTSNCPGFDTSSQGDILASARILCPSKGASSIKIFSK